MKNGFWNRFIEVNLSCGTVDIIQISEEKRKKYIGGSGLGAKILSERTGKDTNPLGKENVLVYMTGPFTGTAVPTSGRHHITAKSPLTGIFGEGDVGGTWGMKLKQAGYDGLIITGKSAKPVYIYINSKKISLNSAETYWGLDTFETDQKFKDEHGTGVDVSCIGPAGENQVLLASIMHNGRHARAVGRTGLGAVMGSKNLKAIVVDEEHSSEIKPSKNLITYNKQVLPDIIKKTDGLKKLGTAGSAEMAEELGDLPIKNWSGNRFENIDKISGQEIIDTLFDSRYYCGSCPIGCGKEIEHSNQGEKWSGAGPEYETVGTLGSLCMNDDLNTLTSANDLCNRYGLDTISTGSVIAFAMELSENEIGIFADKSLNWGDGEDIINAINKIAYKEEYGELLGLGVKKAANIIGENSNQYAIHVKGLEFPAHDPRAFNSLAVGYATSNRGACHLQGATYFLEKGAVLPELGYTERQDRFSNEGKGKLNFHCQNLMAIMDSLKLCKFLLFGGVGLTDIVNWFKIVTDLEITEEELMLAGERIYNLKRLYNINCGISRKDDILPKRILDEPRNEKAGAKKIPFKEMLDEYYIYRGWDDEGIPTQETLNKLDIKFYQGDDKNE